MIRAPCPPPPCSTSPTPAAFAWVEQRLGTRFTGASLATTRGDWQLPQAATASCG